MTTIDYNGATGINFKMLVENPSAPYSYGEFYLYDSFVSELLSPATWEQFNEYSNPFTNGSTGPSSNVDNSLTSSETLIGQTGTYYICANFSVQTNASSGVMEFQVRVNDVAVDNMKISQKRSYGDSTIRLCGLANLNADDVVEIWYRTTGNSSAIVTFNSNFSVFLIPSV